MNRKEKMLAACMGLGLPPWIALKMERKNPPRKKDNSYWEVLRNEKEMYDDVCRIIRINLLVKDMVAWL